jgi:hypothetical protein
MQAVRRFHFERKFFEAIHLGVSRPFLRRRAFMRKIGQTRNWKNPRAIKNGSSSNTARAK